MDGEFEDARLQVVSEADASVVVVDDGVLTGCVEDRVSACPVGVHGGERVVAQRLSCFASPLGDALVVARLSEGAAIVVHGGRDVDRLSAPNAELFDTRYGAAGMADEVADGPDAEPGASHCSGCTLPAVSRKQATACR